MNFLYDLGKAFVTGTVVLAGICLLILLLPILLLILLFSALFLRHKFKTVFTRFRRSDFAQQYGGRFYRSDSHADAVPPRHKSGDEDGTVVDAEYRVLDNDQIEE